MDFKNSAVYTCVKETLKYKIDRHSRYQPLNQNHIHDQIIFASVVAYTIFKELGVGLPEEWTKAQQFDNMLEVVADYIVDNAKEKTIENDVKIAQQFDNYVNHGRYTCRN